MKLDKRTLRALRVPLLALAVSLLLGAAIVAHTQTQLRQEEARLGQLRTAYAMAQQRVMRSGDEKNLIVRYLDDYQRLQEQGFIGTESRIGWLDALRASSDELKLFGVEYAIDPQQASTSVLRQGNNSMSLSSAPGKDGLELRQTMMLLRLSLLHEGDLLRFFDHLAAQNVGLFSIESCNLQRIGDLAQNTALLMPTGVQPNLQAECRLAWFTVTSTEARP